MAGFGGDYKEKLEVIALKGKESGWILEVEQIEKDTSHVLAVVFGCRLNSQQIESGYFVYLAA